MANNILKSKLDADQVIRRAYDDDKNRLRVDAEVEAVIGAVDVVIDASTGDNIAIANSDGTEFVEITNGALNVFISDDGLTTKNLFSEVIDISSGITTEIISYTAIANTNILSCDVSGTNVATYSLYIGGNLSAKKYTYFQNLNERFDFGAGLPVNIGDIISIEVVHERPDIGDFSVNLLIKN